MKIGNRQRPGFTLMELLVTITLIVVTLSLGMTMIRTDDIDKTRYAAQEVADTFRRARFVAARQNRAVTVVVRPFGSTNWNGDGPLRGAVQAYLAPDTQCPDSTWVPAGDPDFEMDFGAADQGDAAGIARISPAELETNFFCIRPNGRIIDQVLGAPIRPLGAVDALDLAGNAVISVQFNPRRVTADDQLIIPFLNVEVPYNGMVRVSQWAQ